MQEFFKMYLANINHIKQNKFGFLFTKLYAILIIVFLASSSCVKHKELLNFSYGPGLSDDALPIAPIPDLSFQVDDLISIQVSALDMDAVAPFNISPNVGGGMNIQGDLSRPLLGYLVDKSGFIDIPIIGRIQVVGLTTAELKNLLIRRLSSYLNDPVVQVRFVNFRISVFGEVNSPGNFVLPNERITILDAISGAGDLTPYANRNNVLIIREYDGKREYGRFDLQDQYSFGSPYYYLKQNDIIYVEPNKIATANTANQASRILPWLSIVTSLTTLTLTIVNISQ